MTRISQYRGRFAPSPTGPLHFGSLVAAIASYLDAKANHGAWLVRIEDVDTPRTVRGAADDILRCLEGFGLEWDGEVIFQSQRTSQYHAALALLEASGHTYPCACTRREIADSGVLGIDGPVYPGVCRNGLPAGRSARSTRVHTAGSSITFDDDIQGVITQDLAREAGDFVVSRADGLAAYQLAVVVDDATQGITNVVRGADLLDSTPRQIHLQQLLGHVTPRYAHVPVAVNAQGEKLSKQTYAPAALAERAAEYWVEVLTFLGQFVVEGLPRASIREIRLHAIANWRLEAVPKTRTRFQLAK